MGMSGCEALPLTLWAGVGRVLSVAVAEAVIEVATPEGSEVPGENCDGLWGV